MECDVQTKTFLLYQGLIKERAFAAFRETGLDRSDLEAQANLIFCYCFQQYDPERGASFSSYLYKKLKWGLADYVAEQKNFYDRESAELSEAPAVRNSAEDDISFREMFDGLSKDAQTVALVALQSPIGLFEKSSDDDGSVWNVRVTKWKLRKYFRGLGWSGFEIDQAFAEIGKALQEAQR